MKQTATEHLRQQGRPVPHPTAQQDIKVNMLSILLQAISPTLVFVIGNRCSLPYSFKHQVDVGQMLVSSPRASAPVQSRAY